MEDRRRRAFRRREVDVARRERQAIGFAHGRAGDDLRRQRQVARHLADDHDLLGVLLAEVGVLGADEREEDGDHGRHAIEVPGTRGALQRTGHRPDPDERVEARRVDLLDRRRPDQVDALVVADGQVAGLVARIALVVGGLVELARVDEDGHDGRGIVGAGALA